MNILVFTTLWPNGEEPNFGVFVKNRLVALSRLDGVQMRVVAPVPYFPKAMARSFVPTDWQIKARIAERETIAGLPVEHPRYLVTPKVGMRYYGKWLARGAESVVRRLHAEQPFDLIDAHYLYPDCYAALQLGRALNLPVVMTARGSDVNAFTRLTYIRPLIHAALTEAAGIISVSSGLKQGMTALGIPEDKIAVIRNGIDRSIFYLRDQAAARHRLGLDPQRKIIVTVGRLIPRKGFDRLIESMAVLAKRPDDKGALLYIIGDGPDQTDLAALIASHNLQDRVFLPGAQLHTELPEWYAAADLFCFLTRSEGCPNVVIEALACGLPVVATDIPGVDELIADQAYGLLLPADQFSPTGFAEKISTALGREWDRQAIATHGAARGWEEVAMEVRDLLSSAIAQHRSCTSRSQQMHS